MSVGPKKQLPMMIVGGMVAGIGALITGLVLVTEACRKN